MHFYQSFTRLISQLIFIGLIMSCSAPNTQQTEKKLNNKQEKVIKKTSDDLISTKQLLKKARKAQATEANELLIQASETYLLEEKPNQALWLANQLLQQNQNNRQRYQLFVVSAQAYANKVQWDNSEKYLQAAATLAEKEKFNHSYAYYFALHELAQKQQQVVTALNAYLHLFTLDNNADESMLENIWQRLNNLSIWQTKQLATLKAPYYSGWLALNNMANQYGGTEQFQSKIKNWQRDFATHPAQFIAQKLLTEEVSSHLVSIERVAVILPLTGKQAKAGITAQQGILAAYNSDPSIELSFIDTNKLDFSQLNQTLLDNNIDFVIGPLLKSNVESYISHINNNIPTLFLNIPNNQLLEEHQFSLSMRPEDEAIQAATILSQQNFTNPVILFNNDSVSSRIANAFSKQWQLLTQHSPTKVKLPSGRKMQNKLKEILAVDESKLRINSLNRLFRENIKAEKRSRRDIDMFYLVGNTQQVRLLKPYIDVNTSPFADVIPIFASSKSHSLLKDKSTYNDLKGLTFTQIPWLLPSAQQNKPLANLSKKIWPKRSDSLQSIFAMGYDSFQLINILPKMQKHQYIRHYGQTGTLKLNQNNIITRSLLWGRYSAKGVSEIVLE